MASSPGLLSLDGRKRPCRTLFSQPRCQANSNWPRSRPLPRRFLCGVPPARTATMPTRRRKRALPMARNHRIRKFCAGLRMHRKPFFRIAPGRREANLRDRAPRAAKARGLFRIRCLFAITGGLPGQAALEREECFTRNILTRKRNAGTGRAMDGADARGVSRETSGKRAMRRRWRGGGQSGVRARGQAADGGRGMGAGERPTGRRRGAARDATGPGGMRRGARRARAGRENGRPTPGRAAPGRADVSRETLPAPAPSAVNARGARPRQHLRLRARRRGCSTRA